MFNETFMSQVMVSNEMITAVIAALVGIAGGGIIEFVNKFLDRDKEEETINLALRKELREEIYLLKQEVESLENQIDGWKQKYFDAIQLTNKLELDIILLRNNVLEFKRLSGIHEDDTDPTHNGWFEMKNSDE